MKKTERDQATELRRKGYSIKDIATNLGVAKSSVSVWVRDIELTHEQRVQLAERMHSFEIVERRRQSRLHNEQTKRDVHIQQAQASIGAATERELWLMGTMLYWAEGGKTQRMVRFSNSDPEMIKIMMAYFRRVCLVPESKFRGYIHIHPHLDCIKAEQYWSDISGIPFA